MAQRLGKGGHDRRHHLLSVGLWDDRPLDAKRARRADRLVGGPESVPVIDDTALPKKGRHPVGVGPRYASASGKHARGQTRVSPAPARPAVPVALRLVRPQSWTEDPARLTRVGEPEDWRLHRTTPEIARDADRTPA